MIRAHETPPPLAAGNHVRIQNQTGRHPNKWDKTGRVIEVRQFDQYVVRLDGSGRVTLRNRRFLRNYQPLNPKPPPRNIQQDMSALPKLSHQPPLDPTTTPSETDVGDQLDPLVPVQPDEREQPSLPTERQDSIPQPP